MAISAAGNRARNVLRTSPLSRRAGRRTERRESDELSQLLLAIRKDHGTSVLLIEHDMSVVMEISDCIFVLDHGVKIAAGTPRERNDPKVIAAFSARMNRPLSK
jgi:ABC-type branched-subunit amino acid transport system ATPase component